jgi:hypothetical protein
LGEVSFGNNRQAHLDAATQMLSYSFGRRQNVSCQDLDHRTATIICLPGGLSQDAPTPISLHTNPSSESLGN